MCYFKLSHTVTIFNSVKNILGFYSICKSSCDWSDLAGHDRAMASANLMRVLVHATLDPRFNALRLRQNGRHFPDDIFQCIFLNENVWISIKISLTFVPKGPINNIPALVQIMARRWSGDKPLSEPMMVSLLMHICVTQPQWWTLTLARLPLFTISLSVICANELSWRLYMMTSCIEIGRHLLLDICEKNYQKIVTGATTSKRASYA